MVPSRPALCRSLYCDDSCLTVDLIGPIHGLCAVKLIELLSFLRIENFVCQTWIIERIAHGAEYAVGLAVADAGIGVEGGQIFPDDLFVCCDFKESAGSAFADKGVAIGQTLAAADVSGIEIHRNF